MFHKHRIEGVLFCVIFIHWKGKGALGFEDKSIEYHTNLHFVLVNNTSLLYLAISSKKKTTTEFWTDSFYTNIAKINDSKR